MDRWTCVFLITLSVMTIGCANVGFAQSQIPGEVLSYPVHLEFPNEATGSGFFVYHSGHCYLVTARHILCSYSPVDSTWFFQDLSFSVTTYARYPVERDSNVLVIALSLEQAQQYCRFADRSDVAAIRIGETDSVLTRYFDFVRKLTPSTKVNMLAAGSAKTYDQVFIGNEVFVPGFPTSIGIRHIPQIDYSKPLLRKGIIAGKNERKHTVLLDCPVYPGNSGGPVFECITSLRGPSIERELFLIGLISQFVPFTQEWVNRRHGNSYIEIANSGYSVVIPIDEVFRLLKEF
jgi:S1-C subfamily serine protease